MQGSGASGGGGGDLGRAQGDSAGRSAGRAPASGRLRVGQIVSACNGKSSIPSRFETILFKGNREADAFGRRTHRFDPAEDEIPGPGSYRRPRTLVHSSPSLSKKGTGAFASGSHIASDRPRALFHTPGPGSYAGAGAGAYASASEGGGGAGAGAGGGGTAVSGAPSAAFARPVPRRAVGVPTASASVNPGPGDYDVAPPPASSGAHGPHAKPSSVFDSRTQRGLGPAAEAAAAAVPGPGAYHPVGCTKGHADVGAVRAAAAGPSAVFRGGGGGGGGVRPPVDPSLGELAKALPQPPHSGPKGFCGAGGPGTTGAAGYRRTSAAAAGGSGGSPPALSPKGLQEGAGSGGGEEGRKEGKRAKPSSMFATTLLDRFGRPVVRYAPETAELPGPGHYEVGKAGQRLLISSSWAMSATDRFEAVHKTAAKPPGMEKKIGKKKIR